MPTQFESLARYVLALVVICLVLGGVYNLGVVSSLGQPEYFYLLSYLDHINSAVMSGGVVIFVLFLVYGVWLVISPLAGRLAALFRLDRLKFEISARLIAAVALGFLLARYLLKARGFVSGDFNTGVTTLVVFVAAGLLLLKFASRPDTDSAVLATLFAAIAAFVLGGSWVDAARANKGPFPLIEADRSVTAKEFKTFSEYTLTIERDGAVVVLRSRDIKKITVAGPAPAEAATGSVRPQQGAQRK